MNASISHITKSTQRSLCQQSSTRRGVMQMPMISLDTTLSDLFRLASPRNAHKRLAFLHDLGHCGLSLTSGVLRSEKFLYQDSVFTNTPRRDLAPGNTDPGLRRLLATKYLNVIPQRDAFISGDSTVVFFGTNPEDARQMCHDQSEAESTMAVLYPRQRPQLVFCAGPCSIPLANSSVDLVAGYKFAFESLETRAKGYSLLVDPETHWLLNSKEALACSGLPTPKTEIIQVTEYAIPASDCCHVCKAAEAHDEKDVTPTIPQACVGQRGAWFRKQEHRIMSAVERRNPPFVMKTQQTFGGGGTWLVRSEQQKRELLRYLSREDSILQKLLPLVTSANHHLHPGSILLSNMVQDPVANYGATFFVTDTGGVLFMGISEQLLAHDGKAWSGSTIDYNSQTELQKRMHYLMEQTAQWLHREHGYCGPVGIDVLETAGEACVDAVPQPRGTRAMHIVDLNVRTSGSMSLPLLRGHFMRLGLFRAGLYTIASERGREDFIKQWEKEFLSGSMILLSWYDDRQLRSSIGTVIVGAVDETSLGDIIQRLQNHTSAVTF